jgi:LacI family transcriptional regulator
MTVSRVLHGRRNKVNEETFARVMSAMKELDYIPVRSAVQNRHVETRAIGLVPYHMMVSRYKLDSVTYEGICEQASQEGYDLLVMLRNESEWLANRHEMRFLDKRSDGFVFISPCRGDWEIAFEALVKHEIPTVVCYRRDLPKEIAWVDADNENIVNSAINRLRISGHQRIAYICGPDGPDADMQLLPHLVAERKSFDDGERRKQFEKVCEDGVVVHACSKGWELDAGVVPELVERGVTATVCVNDLVALQIWSAAEEAGLIVPRDMSIIGVDNTEPGKARGLSSVDFGYDEIGRQAVSAWVALNSGQDARDCCRVVPCTLIERQSVAAARV